MKNYTFTETWFTNEQLSDLINLNPSKENHILEIGSFEGRSTIWFLDTFLSNPNSTITCVDPWLNYSQDEESFKSYEKDETEWNFKNKNIKSTFLNNMIEYGEVNKVYIEQGFSHEILPKMLTTTKRYDVIFIDGNHTAPFVLSDAIFSWYLLKPGGYMIFDDYLWCVDKKETLRPKLSIDSFINIFADYLEVIGGSYTKIIKKKN